MAMLTWAMHRNASQFSTVTDFITPLSTRPRFLQTSIHLRPTLRATSRLNRKSTRSLSSSSTIISSGRKIWVGSTQRVDSRIDTDTTSKRPRCSLCRQAQFMKQIHLLQTETMATPITAARTIETHLLCSNRKFQFSRSNLQCSQ